MIEISHIRDLIIAFSKCWWLVLGLGGSKVGETKYICSKRQDGGLPLLRHIERQRVVGGNSIHGGDVPPPFGSWPCCLLVM